VEGRRRAKSGLSASPIWTFSERKGGSNPPLSTPPCRSPPSRASVVYLSAGEEAKRQLIYRDQRSA
jgi:hypothetical protein